MSDGVLITFRDDINLLVIQTFQRVELLNIVFKFIGITVVIRWESQLIFFLILNTFYRSKYYTAALNLHFFFRTLYTIRCIDQEMSVI